MNADQATRQAPASACVADLARINADVFGADMYSKVAAGTHPALRAPRAFQVAS